MKRLFTLGAAMLAFPAAAFAQHAGHESQPPAPPAPAPEAAAPACTPEHAAMGHCTMPPVSPVPNPHAGHTMPAAPEPPSTDPHSGHDMGTASPPQASDPRAGHTMPGITAPDAPPVAPPPPEAFSGPEHPAAMIFDPAQFAQSREAMINEHGGAVTSMVLVDQLEYRAHDGKDGYAWDIQGWYGGDYDRLWLKSEGEGAFGESPKQVEVQALYSRAIDPWFNVQAGIHHDFRPDPERTHVVLGIQGLAPYWFEVGAALFLSNKGELTARVEAEYNQRITQKLILQPAVEFDLSAQNVPELGIGSGLSTASAGLRLRYEFVPEFAPYIGVEYERAFGNTADFRRAAAENVGGWNLLAGIRLWF